MREVNGWIVANNKIGASKSAPYRLPELSFNLSQVLIALFIVLRQQSMACRFAGLLY